VAGASLGLGIVIGFASGYRTGQRQDALTPGIVSPASAPTSGAASGKPFSESTVDAPVRVEEPPIVAAPDPKPVPAPPAPRRSEARTAKPAVPAPAPRRRESEPAVAPAPPQTDVTRSEPVFTPSGPGSLQVVSRPSGAQVFLDGRSVGRTPLLIPEVTAGSHEVRLDLPGFNRWVTTVDVKAGSAERVAASLEQ